MEQFPGQMRKYVVIDENFLRGTHYTETPATLVQKIDVHLPGISNKSSLKDLDWLCMEIVVDNLLLSTSTDRFIVYSSSH